MVVPLRTQDARELRRLARPRWQRRVLAWTLPVAASVVTGLHVSVVGPSVCTVREPCRPDLLGSVAFALLFTAAVSGLVFPRLATWFASGFVACLVVSERLLQPSLVSPAWLYVVDAGLVGLCVLLARVDRHRPPTDRARQWLAGVRRERPPAVDLPRRPGRVWRGAGWVLASAAAAGLVWGWYAQQRTDARQRVATRVAADVTAHIDQFTVEVHLPSETVRIGVLEAANYPVGERMELYVDDRGLRQPVSEPYDATPWGFLGVFLAGIAFAFRLRGVEREIGLGGCSPSSSRSPRSGRCRVLGWSPCTPVTHVRARRPSSAIPTGPAVHRDEDHGRLTFTGADLEAGLHAASLYGTPAPGHWCVVVVDGRPVVPTRPISARSVVAPPYGHHLDAGVEDMEPPRLADLPLRAEEVATLRPDDRAPTPVRSGRVSQSGRRLRRGRGASTLSWSRPVGSCRTCPMAWPCFSPVPPWPPRVRCPGGCSCGPGSFGMTAESPHSTRSVRAASSGTWSATSSMTGTPSPSTRQTADVAIGAGPLFGMFGRRDRGAEELAHALRHARSAALAGDRGRSGPDRDGREDDLPHLDPPRRPAGLYVLWLSGTPLLAWTLQVFSTG